MENSFPKEDISVDYLASYLAYALRVLKNCGLPCEGITTPGGFGNRVKDKLPIAVHQAVRDVFGTQLPHYFKYITGENESTFPKLEFTDPSNSPSDLTMNIPAGTGDWFGGWEGSRKSEGHRYASDDGQSGRMIDMILRNEPAVMLCHWPGMYCNGKKSGFEAFKKVVLAIAGRFKDQTRWMKLSEIGRYEAAKNLTTLTLASATEIKLEAPLSCRDFTFEYRRSTGEIPYAFKDPATQTEIKHVRRMEQLKSNTCFVEGDRLVVSLDLPTGPSRVLLRSA